MSSSSRDPHVIGAVYSRRSRKLSEQYHWKAETIVRWFRTLEMTDEQKVDFLAKEFAGVHMYGEAHPYSVMDEVIHAAD